MKKDRERAKCSDVCALHYLLQSYYQNHILCSFSYLRLHHFVSHSLFSFSMIVWRTWARMWEMRISQQTKVHSFDGYPTMIFPPIVGERFFFTIFGKLSKSIKKLKSEHESNHSNASCTDFFLVCAGKHTTEMRLSKKNALKMKSKIRWSVHETVKKRERKKKTHNCAPNHW